MNLDELELSPFQVRILETLDRAKRTLTTDDLVEQLHSSREEVLEAMSVLQSFRFVKYSSWKQRVRTILGRQQWPYGAFGDRKEADATKLRLIQWAEHNKLRLVRDEGACLHWLTKGRCTASQRQGLCNEGHGGHDWLDHVTGWIDAHNHRLLISQPYGGFDYADLVTTAKRFDLTVNVNGDGWYGYGTVCIELRNASEDKD